MRIALLFLLVWAPLAGVALAETITLRGAAQGTTYHIKYVVPAKAVDRALVQGDVEKLLAEIDRQMSTYRPDSEISRFNQAPANEWFPVSKAVVDVVNAARVISEKTGGAMDVTVGPLVRLWHFGPRSRKTPSPLTPLPKGEGNTNGVAKGEGNKKASPKGEGDTKQSFEPPTDDQIQNVRSRIGYRQLNTRLDPPALRKQVAGLEVDLSSIASGYTIDHLADVLQRLGIKNYMVELGGEVTAAGKHEDGTPWRVAIERPTAGDPEMVTAVPLVNAALATAGGTHKFFEYKGQRYSHIIDPATGRPVEHALASVSVAADTCLEADGWDTPLLVLGPDRGFECAEKYDIAAMFISHEDAGDSIKTTAAWRRRFGELRETK